jgi:transcriptional antiterminator Rof (Rho-off)
MTEKAKEGVEKNGLTDQAASLERRIKNYKFVGERIEDVLNVASQFYNELLVTLGETERYEARGEERREAESEETRIEEKEKEKREERRKR